MSRLGYKGNGLYTVDGSINWHNIFGKEFNKILQHFKSISSLRIYAKKINLNLQRC